MTDDKRAGIDAHLARGVLVGDAAVQNNYFTNRYLAWPIQLGRPPVLAHAFQPRRQIADTVASRLTSSEVAIHTEIYVGDGGVGKTQFAAGRFASEAAHRDLRLWVDAATRSSIVSSYSQICTMLSGSGQAGEDPEVYSRLFLGWLNATNRPWLIVLDDLSDPGHLLGLWPAGPAGRTIVTTRRRDATLQGSGRAIFHVGVFESAESRSYLSEKMNGTSNPLFNVEDAEKLAEDLGNLPVALAQAAAVMIDQGWSCSRYRRMFAARAESLADLFPPDAAADEYIHTVSTAWALAVERADTLDPVGFVRPVLAIAALLDPNGIPQPVWETDAVCLYANDQGRTAPTLGTDFLQRHVHRALRALNRLSLVSHDTNDPMHAVRIHALVQRATVEQIPKTNLARTASAAADALLQVWPPIEQDAVLARVLRQNAASLIARVSTILIGDRMHPLFHRYGASLGEAGLVAQAADYWEQLTATVLGSLAPGHPDCLSTRHEAIRWRAETGDPYTAVVKFEALVRDRERFSGAESIGTLTSRHELARWRGETGDAIGAAEAFSGLLSDLNRVLGREHPNTLAAQHEMAYHWGESGDGERAALAFADLVKLRTRILGRDHPHTLAARHNEARWIGHSGQPLKAVVLFHDLLEDRKRVLGSDHPETMRTEHNLANWKGLAGDVYGAIEGLRVVLEHRVAVLGERHPENLRTRLNLSRWRGEGGNPARALDEFRVLVDDHLAMLRPNSPQTLRARSNLARFHGESGNIDAAVAGFTGLVPDYERSMGTKNPYTLRTRYALARWEGEGGNYPGAIQAMERLLGDYMDTLGPRNQYTLHVRRGLARWRGGSGDPLRAVHDLESLVADYSSFLGTQNPHTLRTRRSLSRWRAEAGDVTRAISELGDVLADYESILPASSPHILRTRYVLAHWLGIGGDSSRAAALYEELLQDYISLAGERSPYTDRVRQTLRFWTSSREGAGPA